MLRIGLGALEQGPVETAGEVAADDPLLKGLDFSLREPVRVSGQLTAAGPGSYYWRGTLETAAEATCRRCLAPAALRLNVPVNVLFTEDQEADDPSVYLIPPRAKTLEMGEAIREELILAMPEYVLCRENCAGLCPQCGKDLNEGPCECQPVSTDPRWAKLEALQKRSTKKNP
ncbi:MAG: DUF177 domain-containing protein [Gemmatimonadetes bacterium]|nr:DUF177 domain-containing protein [Gemmatimonadota bacterium]